MPEETDEQNPKNADDFMATARARFDQDVSEEQSIRNEAEIDVRFEAGDQWDEKVRQDRITAGRPVMTFNRSHTFVQQVSNEARQNRSQVKFIPSEDGDKDTAEVYEGLARHIQYNSQARIAFETAMECAAGGSFGFFRYLPEYCSEENSDQEIKVVPVFNPFAIYGVLFPACLNIEPRHAFVVEYLTKEEYKLQYPDSDMASLDWDEAQATCGDWVGDKVRIAEYWVLEETPQPGRKPKRSVKFYKINGVEVLEETTWLGRCIPIFPVLGKLRFVDGAPQLFSVIRFQRDAQRLVNVYKTRIGEIMMTQPIQPYLVPKGSISPQDRVLWERMNLELRSFLEYNVVDAAGKPVPPPIRQVFEPPIAALSAAALQEIDDMKATAGIYDASLGQRSNETSGRAIQKREQQASLTNLHFLDNLDRTQQKAGAELAYVIPKYYDTPRMVRILGEDEASKIVRINQPFQEQGKEKFYHVGGNLKVGGKQRNIGKYDVVVTMGRAFSSKRMESFDMMAQVLMGSPDILPMIGDIFFRNSDLAGADQLAERFKKMLPPNLQDQPEGQQPVPPEIAQKLAALMQQHEALTQALNDANQKLESKLPELESKERMETARLLLETQKLELEKQKLLLESAKIDSADALKAAQIESTEAIAVLKADIEAIKAGMQFEAAEAARQAQQGAEAIQAGN